ncbi:ABC transporter NBP/MSD fusion protein [Leifsonia xyli subsp. cynodontis DSM 46306]|uniref:Uncharacterized protein n=1 Tax=Leifsonia xyli subsp. cynodontis DSM 46306 TaxID=1389489 RepID=U3P7V8_LEIXC|nr:ATP-binding protein [Leifsonia xyli]AGW42360.1 ABC transporter NBP/MSD fusion protein [Leifsonia xyli subsp. cynodontis DSM 46306]
MNELRLTVMALGSPIELRLDATAAPGQDLAPLVESWDWCRAPVGTAAYSVLRGVLDPEGAFRVSVGDGGDVPTEVVARSLDELAERLTVAVTHIALASQPEGRLLLHAAGFAHPVTGAAVALVGPSGAGKSTVSQALGRELVYCSDESVAVTSSGRVLSYQKPVSIKVPGRPFKRQASPQEFGMLRSGAAGARLRRILVLDREPSHTGAPELRPLLFREAVEHILPQTSYFVRGRRPLAAFAAALDRCGGAFAVRYSEAAGFVPVVAELLSDDALIEALTRADVEDELTVDGDLVLLRDGIARVLHGLGAQIWRLLDRPRTMSEIVAGLEEHLGAPADGSAASLAASAVATLEESRLVAWQTVAR